MAVNSTLKSICGLIHHSNPDTRMAAVRILGAIHSHDPLVYRSLGEAMLSGKDTELIPLILEAFEISPSEHALKYLIDLLDKLPEHQMQALSCIAKVGGKAVSSLKAHFARSASPVRRKIVQAMPRIRTPQAHTFLVECFFDLDHELIRDAVHAVREQIDKYNQREKADLYTKVADVLKERRSKGNASAQSALIIVLGIIADVRCKSVLLPLTHQSQPYQARRHALMSLSRLELSSEKHHDVFKTLTPILSEADYEGIVRHAVQVLMGVKPKRSDADRLQHLLESRHTGVQVYAIHSLSQINTISNAEKIIEFLHSSDMQLRDAASQALRNMPAAVNVILKHIDVVTDRAEALHMVKILESHSNRINPERAREMVQHMLDLNVAGDDHYQLYRVALLNLRSDVLQKELLTIGSNAFQKKDFNTVRDTLKLLDGTELMTPQIRFMLATAKIRTSPKDLSRSFRLADYCLEHIVILLKEDLKGFPKKLMAEKNLEADDLLYIGYHFSERLNEERRFGVDILRHVIKKWPRSKAAGEARKKLKVEGH